MQTLSVKPGQACSSPMESQYFTCSMTLPAVCAQCGEGGDLLPIPAELSAQFTAVLQICAECDAAGKQNPHRRAKGGAPGGRSTGGRSTGGRGCGRGRGRAKRPAAAGASDNNKRARK